jgi:hypothetical protein
MRRLLLALGMVSMFLVSARGTRADSLPESGGFLYNGSTYSAITVPGATLVTPMGVNDLGQVVGGYSTGSNYTVFSFGTSNSFDVTGVTQSAFYYTGGTISSIAPQGSGLIQASGINDSGSIIGYGSFSPNPESAFLEQSSGSSTLNVPGSSGGFTTARAINNSGEIVGTFLNTTAGFVVDGYLYSNGNYETVAVTGATVTELLGINNDGQILGESYSASSGTSFFIDASGVFTDITVPCSGQAGLGGFNDDDQIGVNCQTASGETAFIYNYVSGISTPLSLPVGSLQYEYITGLSDNGNVVGYYATPEPSSLTLLSLAMAAMLGLTAVALRRRGHSTREAKSD